MSNTSATCALLYVVAMWPDCHFRDIKNHPLPGINFVQLEQSGVSTQPVVTHYFVISSGNNKGLIVEVIEQETRGVKQRASVRDLWGL